MTTYPKTRRYLPALLALGVCLGALAGARAENRAYPAFDDHDRTVIADLVTRMEKSDINRLPAIDLAPYQLPGASIDVMRVRMEETYTIQGIGKDTVELRGWIAVVHDRPISVVPKAAPTWDTAITPTEFVGLHLQGDSKLFGKVDVALDDSTRVRGAVGALYMPFMEQVVADLSYRDLRGPHPEQSPVYIARPLPIEYRWRNGGVPMLTADVPAEKDQAEIRQVISEVLAGINQKDAGKMLAHYTTQQGAFFGPNDAVYTNVKQYREALGQIFANLKSVKATPNNDLSVRIMGNSAVAALTGRNEIVDREGRSASSPWRWSLQFERERSGWKIATEHLSFIALRSKQAKGAFSTPLNDLSGAKLPEFEAGRIAPELNSRIEAAKCNCTAAVYVKVFMPNLQLTMRTSSPVEWYSEVTTIPPIGETASKSINSAPLQSGSREIGTLLSGLVKFREVIARESLHGTASGTGVLALR